MHYSINSLTVRNNRLYILHKRFENIKVKIIFRIK